MINATNGNRGIRWGLQGCLEDLDFADDICLLAHRHSHMQDKMRMVEEMSARVGRKINVRKTKMMRINRSTAQPLLLQHKPIEVVTLFVYLGCTITKTGGSS